MAEKELEFLRYNEENLLEHLLAIEDHARYLNGNERPEHLSCIVKHVLQTIEQASEGISHSTVAAPDKTGYFVDIRDLAHYLLMDLEGANTEDLIPKVRKIRSIAEKFNPAFKVSECKSCVFESPIKPIMLIKEIPAVRERITEIRTETIAIAVITLGLSFAGIVYYVTRGA